MSALLLLAPLFLLFEVVQLIAAERYVGIKQIARGGDPRAAGLPETAAFIWVAAIALYALWMLLLLAVPMPLSRVHGLVLLAVSAVGFSLRRNTGLKWTLVILTFEGAVRVGLLLSLLATAWRRLG